MSFDAVLILGVTRQELSCADRRLTPKRQTPMTGDACRVPGGSRSVISRIR